MAKHILYVPFRDPQATFATWNSIINTLGDNDV